MAWRRARDGGLGGRAAWRQARRGARSHARRSAAKRRAARTSGEKARSERERLETQIRDKLLKVYQIEVEAIKEERDDYIQRLNDNLENGAADGREMKKRLGQAT